MHKIIAALKIFTLFILCLIVIPLQWTMLKITKGPASYIIPNIWQSLNGKVFQMKIVTRGNSVTDRQVFFVGNHLSHFDIFVLGWLKASFLAKDDIANWPVFGFLTKLQQTGFISRSSKDVSQVKNNVGAMIDEGKNIIMFPEGTSTRGDTVLDFKSSLFSLPLAHAQNGLLIQPFTIVLLKVDGKRADTKELKDLYAWDRDNPIDIGPHIWNFAQTSGAELELIFHDPIEIGPDEDRKALARRIQQIVAQPLDKSLELASGSV